MKTGTMQAKIMRRVYYTYALSILTHSMLWKGVFLGAAAMLLTRWLYVAKHIENFLSTPVGSVPQYVFNTVLTALEHGRIIMVLTLLAAVVIGLSSLYQLGQSLLSQRLSI